MFAVHPPHPPTARKPTGNPLPRPHRLLLFLLIILGGSIPPLSATKARAATQPGKLPQPTYARQTWLQSDGLPESTVQAFALDREGYLWIGTTAGLVRFDGYKFVVYNRDSTPPLPENSVFSLLTTADGDLLVGTEGGGLVVMSHGRFRTFGPREGLTDGFVRSLYQDSARRIWVGTDNGVFLLEHDRLLRIGGEPTRDLAVHAITEGPDHRIWVGGSSLFAFSPTVGGWQAEPYQLEGVYSQNRVKSLLATRDGTLWVGTVGGLERLEHANPIQHSAFTGHSARTESFHIVPGLHATVRTLAQTPEGDLLIGTIGGGLWSDRNGTLAPAASSSLLPSHTILALFQDRMGQLWVGTQNGMVRLTTTPVSVIPLPGASDPDFATIACDIDSTVWVASSRLYLIVQGVATPASLPALPRVPVRNVFRARDGSLWVGTDGDGVYHLEGAHTTHLKAPGELTNNFVRAILEASDGSLWIGTDDGLNHITPSGIARFEPADGLAHFSIRALLEDRRHDIWIGTEQGLSHWHNGGFVHDALTDAMQHEKLWSLLEDRTGALWLGTRDHGLFRWSDGHLRHYTLADGLASNSIYQILQDAQGTLWISSPNRIFSLTLADDAATAGASTAADANLHVITYEMPYDAAGTQMYGGRQSSGCIDPGHSIWFPSTRGALRVQPSGPSHPADPVVHIDSIVANGRTWYPADSTGHASDAAVVLPPGATRTEFVFSALLLRPQEDLRFRYRLDPLDKNWTYAGVARTAAYTNLPSGHYRFRVEVDQTGHFGRPGETSIAIDKLPHFYERWWFLLLVGLLVVALVVLIYRLRTRQLRLRFEAVLEERTRLAREMHDTVIQGCTSVSALLEAMACMPAATLAPPAPEAAPSGSALHAPANLLDHARAQVRTTIQEARDAVWDLRHSDDATHDLATSIAAIAADARDEFDIPVEILSEGRPALVVGPVAHELLMVVREAVYNAVQHGREAQPLSAAPHDAAKQDAAKPDAPPHPRLAITIRILYTRSSLTIEVRDTGRGFDPATLPAATGNHYGILGMKERMRHLGGSLRLNSRPGAGTVVTLQLRRSHLLRRLASPSDPPKAGTHANPS